MPARLAVFASGGGSNLQALIDHFHPRAEPAARVELLVASRAGAGALERAERARVASLVLGPAVCGGDAFPGLLLDALREHAIDWIVLAGYLQLVPAQVVDRYAGRIVNIHPALLPSFGGKGMYGMHVHRAVIAAGARVSGATVHLVDEQYDRGPVVAQWPVPVLPEDTPEELAARVLRVEHLLLPAAVEALVSGSPGTPMGDPVAFDLISAPAPPEASIQRALRQPPRR
jgi:phosphoribosylglycinamide formyltransferase-1